MPKPDTALVFGMEPIKDVRRVVVQVSATGTTIPIYDTGGLKACAVHIYPHTEPVFMAIDRADVSDYDSLAWLKNDMYHDYVIMLDKSPDWMGAHNIYLLSPKATTVTLNFMILAS